MTLQPGARLGRYEVVSALGAGGMGEVYRATDTTLKRQVAIKIITPSVAADPDRLARFQREAEVLAAMNHPNIAALYGMEDADGVKALVMELVEGPTLADRIGQRPIPVDEAMRIARQLAEALEAAHEQGIIHRDLKPTNIKVRPDGTVKVLDFGLAKLATPDVMGAGLGAGLSQSPTMTAPPMMTDVGVILGTAAYMAPEQARGQVVDRRADIWAFGCVCFEMLSGQRAFGGELMSDVLASVLKTDPTWLAVRPGTPAALRRLLHRCLEKDPKRRLQAIGEARIQIENLLTGATEPETAPAAPPRATRLRRVALIGGTLIVGAAMGIGSAWLALRPAAPRVSRTSIVAMGPAAPTISVDGEDLAITPDGSRIVYVGNSGTQLFVRALDALEPLAIVTGLPHAPFVSPDGLWVGFIEHNMLKKVAIAGGPPITIATLETEPNAAAWAPDDTILFAMPRTLSGLMRVSAGGGLPEALTKPDRAGGEAYHAFPQVLPGGRQVLFTIVPLSGNVETAQIAVRDLRTGSQQTVFRGGEHAYYVSSGHLVYAAAGTLRAVPFDLSQLRTHGTPVPVVPRLLSARGIPPRDFAVATDGTLVYVDGGSAAGTRTLVWVDREGKEDPIAAPPRAYVYPRLSPDGTRLAVSIADQDYDVWLWDVRQTSLAPLTFDPAQDSNPVWTPNGQRIIFASMRDGGLFNLWWQAADGTGVAERLTTGQNQLPTGISPDGTQVLFNKGSPATGRDVMALALNGSRSVTPLVQTPLEDRNAQVSPDGRWLAYESNSKGRFEIYLRPFPNVQAGQWQVSTAGGTRPIWAHSANELFFLDLDGALVRVPIGETGIRRLTARPDASPGIGTPVKLLGAHYFTGGISPTYDVSADGRRFLMIKASAADANPAPPGIIVVLHFDEQLKRLIAGTR